MKAALVHRDLVVPVETVASLASGIRTALQHSQAGRALPGQTSHYRSLPGKRVRPQKWN
jgi:hypothetical protein